MQVLIVYYYDVSKILPCELRDVTDCFTCNVDDDDDGKLGGSFANSSGRQRFMRVFRTSLTDTGPHSAEIQATGFVD